MAEHVLPRRTYYTVFAALIVLTLTTVFVSDLPLGRLHMPVALAIAVAKGVLVVLFFMHVLYSPRLTWLVIAAALFWLAILMVLTLTDYLSRGWLPLTNR
jgi:cytochrome c oxidase subunit 4